jgi:hypothetical protein
MVDLDDRAALGAGGPVRSRGLVDGSGVCAGQGRSSSGTASKLWVNNRGSGGHAQAIPQRIYIFTKESFVCPADDLENPLNRGVIGYRLAVASRPGVTAERANTVSQQDRSRSVETGDVVYSSRLAG